MNGHQNVAFSHLIGALKSPRNLNGYGADYAPICTLMIIFFHFYMKWKSKDCELIKYKAPIVRTIHGHKGPICLIINFKGDTVRTYYPFYKLSWNERGNVYDGLYNAVLSLKEPMDGYIIIEDIEFVRKE